MDPHLSLHCFFIAPLIPQTDGCFRLRLVLHRALDQVATIWAATTKSSLKIEASRW
ncbi:hypothetical protein Fmac_027168 [Flemingia macrophylla]|uniref:Uncharacterized protein n=1 Tax=Flemingia macrophylla TaxID=520843 RepID=A0ABD1LGY6_9FABA